VLGKRSNQRGLFEADTMYVDFVGKDTFYGWLACQPRSSHCNLSPTDSNPPIG